MNIRMSIRASVCALGALVISFLNAAIAAETETLHLDEVTVSAKRPVSTTQPDIKTATEDINKTAGGVDIVDMEQVREGRVSNLNDTLGMAAGVFVQSRFGAEESRLSIRGSGLQRNFHGLGIKIMQDGIPLNLADGSSDFPGIDPLATRYIEVYRGANALQFGASNLGGAINFISPTGYNAPKFEVRTELGSFGYNRLGIATGDVIDNLDYFFSASTYGQDGFRHDADQSAQRINANIGYKINDNIETRFYLGYVNSDSDLPGNLSKQNLKDNPKLSQYEADPFNPALIGTGQWKRNIDQLRIANKTTFSFDDNTLELGAFYAKKKLFHPIIDLFYFSPFIPTTIGVIDQHSDDYGITARLKHQGEQFGLKNELIVGASPTYGTNDDKRFRNINGNRGAMTNRYDLTATNLEVYTEDTLHVTPEIAVIAGLQHAYSTRKLNDKFINPATGDESFDESYSQTNPKLGVLYEPQKNVQLFANLSRSFAPPDFGDLPDPTTAKSLKAQKATTFEIGSRGNSAYVDWDVAYYYARLKDEFLAVSPIPGVTDTTNADKSIHEGLELAATVHLPLNLEWQNNLLINHFRLDNDATFGDTRIPGIQKSVLRGELMYRKNSFYIGPTYEISPQRYAVDFAETLYADSYAIFGLKVGQKVNEHWSWFLEGRNLSDKKYAATTDVLKVFDPSSDRPFSPGDGRSAYAGVTWNY